MNLRPFYITGIVIILLIALLYIWSFSHLGISSNPNDWTQTASFFSAIFVIIISLINLYIIVTVSIDNKENARKNQIVLNSQITLEVYKSKLGMYEEYIKKIDWFKLGFQKSINMEISQAYRNMVKYGQSLALEVITNAKEDGAMLGLEDWDLGLARLKELLGELGSMEEDGLVPNKLGELRSEFLIEFNVIISTVNNLRNDILNNINQLISVPG